MTPTPGSTASSPRSASQLFAPTSGDLLRFWGCRNDQTYLEETLDPWDLEVFRTRWPHGTSRGQRPPEGEGWRTWLFLGGRGAGKTRAGAEWLGEDDLALPDDAPDSRSLARTLDVTPDLARVRYLDADDGYRSASVVLRADAPGAAGSATLNLPVVLDAATATDAGRRRLLRALAERDAVTVHVSPLAALRAEPGDLLTVEGVEDAFRVVRADWDEASRLQLTRAERLNGATAVVTLPTAAPIAAPAGPPALQLLDLPPLEGDEEDSRMLAAVASKPWRPYDLYAGPSAAALTRRGTATEPTTLGRLACALPSGPLHRWDRATRLLVQLDSGTLVSRSTEEVLSGLNGAAVRGADGDWEVLQFAQAAAVGAGVWSLSLFLRGQLGTAAVGAPVGSPFVLLGPEMVRLDEAFSERGLPLIWRAAPAGTPAGGLAMTEASAVWAGVWWRPWAPSHLRARFGGGGLSVDWVRRARLHGDPWDGDDPPLSEESERYRLELLDGAGMVLLSTETATPTWSGPAPAGVAAVRVAQGSAVWGWGATAQRDLLP